MTRYVVALVWLVLAWVTFWQDVSVANLLSGVLLAVILLALFPFESAPGGRGFRPVPLLRFAAVFVWSVVKANLIVAWEVITPWNRINEGVVAVTLHTDDPIVVTMISHAIILAPGTMVIDIERKPHTVLFVHALHLTTPEAVRDEVLTLERLAVAAFPPRRGAPSEGSVA